MAQSGSSFADPYIPNVNNILAAGAQGYAMGNQMRQQNALSQAGQALASGDQTGAKNALYNAGEVESGLKLEDHFRQVARQADADKLAKAALFNEKLGNLAMLADTPEKWQAAIAQATRAGLDVAKYGDFAARDFVLAQAGKANEVLSLELNRRKAETEKSQYEFTKTGVGNKYTGVFKPYAKGQGTDPELTLEQGKYEQGLRKEYTSLTSDMRTVSDALGRLRTSVKSDSGAGDIATVYSYMKMLDPTSVVREGEYATAENTGGVPTRITNLYNKLLTGKFLSPEQRAEFLKSAEDIAKDKSARFERVRSQFEDIARSSGAEPSRIMLDEGMNREAPRQTAKKPSPFREYPQAKQAPDGHWYVEQNGKFFRVDQ